MLASSVAATVDQVVRPGLDPDDPDADLEAMTDEQLRRHIDELRASADRRSGAVLRRLKAAVLLRERDGAAQPRWVRAAFAASPSKGKDLDGPRRPQFRTMLAKVTAPDAGPLAVEKFAEWLAVEFWDVSAMTGVAQIARGLRDGVVRREVVAQAYRRAKRPGIRMPSAFFRRYVWDRSPWAALPRSRGRWFDQAGGGKGDTHGT